MGFSSLFLRFHPEVQPRPIVELDDGAASVDLTAAVSQIFYVELTENSTLTLQNPKDGGRYSFVVQQDAGGANTFALAGADIYWEGGTAPTVTSAGSAIDVITLVYSSILVGYLGAIIQALEVP